MLTRGRRGCFVNAELPCIVMHRVLVLSVLRSRRKCIRLLVMWFVGHAGKRVALRNSVGR
jgi:hypothetical protein